MAVSATRGDPQIAPLGDHLGQERDGEPNGPDALFTEGLDSETAQGRFFRRIHGAVAKCFLDRTRAGDRMAAEARFEGSGEQETGIQNLCVSPVVPHDLHADR